MANPAIADQDLASNSHQHEALVMNNTSNQAEAVPFSRLARLMRLGSLAGGVAGGMIAEGVRQFTRGERLSPADMMLTPANARRVADQLASLRGAAMKVGQLLSLDAGDLLPRELADILSRLRAEARPMPMSQVAAVLDAGWGTGWYRRFRQFSFTPMAAASIGQVHSCVTADGRRLAVKVQYPGIRQSIDSDVGNVASLLRMTQLLPAGLDIVPLLEEARRQLHEEANYLREAEHLVSFQSLLHDTPELVLPDVDAGLTQENILAMTYMEGEPVESLIHAGQKVRNRVIALLLELLFRELFEFRLIQTDPNFANFLYDGESQHLVLLDYGATRVYPEDVTEAYRQLLSAGMRGDRPAMSAALQSIGYFRNDIPASHRHAVITLFHEAMEPARLDGCYDFGGSDLSARLYDSGLALSQKQGYWHTPPADALFLHRKLGGLYLLAARLGARVDVRSILERHLQGQ
jgi:predicted unusual protein kinase regulating ubiquinone biosynthesis (AarF/ABC1/UbiB family)